MKVPVKTRLPVEAWVLAALVTLFSVTHSIVHHPSAEQKVQHASIGDTLTASFTTISEGISDLTALPRRTLWPRGDRG